MLLQPRRVALQPARLAFTPPQLKGVLARPQPSANVLRSVQISITGSASAADQASSSQNHSSEVSSNGADKSLHADARAILGSTEVQQETASGSDDSAEEDTSTLQPQPPPPPAVPATAAQKAQQFANRVIFGIVLGLGGAAVILKGDLPFLAVALFVTFQGSKEYNGFITSKGIAKGMTPPPPTVSVLTTLLCVGVTLTSYFFRARGRHGTVLAVAAFALLVMQVIAIKKPKFSQMAGSLFGLFYCGWLPAFWVKLRLVSTMAPTIPLLEPLSGLFTWTVGLVATLATVACVIAADTGAFFVGKTLGRTKLTDISPKKTVEGALGGLASSVTTALLMWKLTQWPQTALGAAGLGVLTFFSSLFGDLIESIMKRDAGMKDSGDLIPGHGGLLDRFDSYMFTGATTYFYVFFVLPWCRW